MLAVASSVYATTAPAGNLAAAGTGPNRLLPLLPRQSTPTPFGKGSEKVCGLAAPGTAQCNALLATNSSGTPLSGSSPASGYYPADLQSAYQLPSSAAGTGETVGIVDAYNDPDAASDLSTYRTQFKLSACTTSNGCLRIVNQTGGSTLPSNNASWAQEISVDLDMVSAICPNCDILLVEASSNSNANLAAAVDEAAALGVDVISNSYGSSESSGETGSDSYYDHPGIMVTASSGDSGYGTEYPAASPYVTAVGGTTLTQSSGTLRGWTETVWDGAGSGCSSYESKPSWQTDTGCAKRTIADVSADANPNTGVAVYDDDSYEGASGWLVFGGTSVSNAIIASVYALGGDTAHLTYGSYPYSHTAWLNNVTSGGSNVSSGSGTCTPSYLCTAGPGYNGPTGWGTPVGDVAFGGASSPPTVTGVSPSSGPTIGGTVVTVTGTNFYASSTTSVKFGGVAASNVSISSSTQLTATSPAGSVGTVNMTVTTPAGSSAASSSDDFVYATPSISGVTLTGTSAAPTVTVAGANFGSQPAGTAEPCQNGDTSDDYANNALSFQEITEGWTAGVSGSCIGLVVSSWSATQVVFTFGPTYSYYSPIKNSDQIEVTVQGATDTVSASFPPTPSISGVTLTGTSAAPTVTVAGANFGSQPAGTAEPCQNGDTSDDYANNALSFQEITEGWTAGVSGSCIGLVVSSWSATQVVFTFGPTYSYYSPIKNSDQIEVTVQGATDTVSASFPPTPSISGVTLTGTSAAPTVTVAGANFGSQPAGTAEPCQNGDTSDDYANNALSFQEITEGWTAGVSGSCIGLVVSSWSATQVVFTFGPTYSYYSPIKNSDQIEVTVQGATDTVSASFPPTPSISGVTLTGTSAAPTVTVAGANFGSQPAGTAEPCQNGDTSDDYANNALSFQEITEGWTAGVSGSCIGLVVSSWSATQVVFTFGPTYSYYSPIKNSDQIEVTVQGATDTVSASFPPTPSISGVTLTGTSAAPTVTVAGANFGSQPAGTAEPCQNGDTSDDYANNALSFQEITEGWTAGVSGSCIGLVVSSWSATQVVFTFGPTYSYYSPIKNSDQIEVTVQGATDTVSASFT